MSKTSMCMKMLQILNSRHCVSIAELASALETNPRNIPEYRTELCLMGYDIKTVPGRYGGYVLDRKTTFPSLSLLPNEKEALFAGYDYLLTRNDFMRQEDYSKAMQKIASSIDHLEIPQNTMIANRFPLAMEQDEIEKRYFAISQCIALKTVIDIKYLSLKNEISERSLHPYKLYMYNNAWYVLGYDESKLEVRYFKLNRIQTFHVTHRSFRIPITYNEREYLDEFGMKNNGEWYPIKLKLTANFAMLVKERIYGKNQTVEAVDDKTTILSVEMQNKDDIVSFVLGFRDKCEVLEPEWLRDEVKATIDNIADMYGR